MLPIVPGRLFFPASSTIAATWPGTARPIEPGLIGMTLAFEPSTRLHSVWPNTSLIGSRSTSVAPFEKLLADRLAAGIDRTRILAPKRSTGSAHLAHQAQHRRHQQRGAHLMPADHGEGLLGIEARRAEREYGNAVIPGGHQHIHQAGEPRPVGRRPHDVTRLREEIEAELGSRQMSEHRAMRLQRAFWIAGCARGEIQEGRIVGRGIDVGEGIACGLERFRQRLRFRLRGHR